MKSPILQSPTSFKLGIVLAILAAGCGREETKVYSVAKELPPAAAHPSMSDGQLPPGHPDTAAAPLRLTWEKPDGWTEVPLGQIRLASFNVKSADGRQADVSAIPLPGSAGGDVANVNRWRGQVGLDALPAEELRKLAQPVEVAGQPAELYDQAGKNPSSGDDSRILAVIQHREGTAWFFKMTGDDKLVAEQKAAFIGFLKSVKYTTNPAPQNLASLPSGHPPLDSAALPDGHPTIDSAPLPAGHPDISSGATTAATPPSSDGKPRWTAPSGWKEVPGGQFLVAKFAVAEGTAQAAVNVSMSAGDGGGLLANLNRWRGQLGQSPWAEAELRKQTREIEVAGGKATLVEMSGTDARSGQPSQVVGAIVPQAGQTWFYKLMGDAKVVETQKSAFVKFVETVKY